MIYIYFSEVGVDWWSYTAPTPEQLDDDNLHILRVAPNVIEQLERLWPANRGHRWQPVFHAGGYYRYVYRGLWGDESRYSTTFQKHIAESFDPEYDTFRIISKANHEYKYMVEFWGSDGDWFVLEQR